MNFDQALKILEIEDYSERIFNSSSTGELFHLNDYILLAENVDTKTKWFRYWFEAVVQQAEEKWKRPESVFQHIPRILIENSKAYN